MSAETISVLLNLAATTAGTCLASLVSGWMDRRRASRGGHLT